MCENWNFAEVVETVFFEQLKAKICFLKVPTTITACQIVKNLLVG